MMKKILLLLCFLLFTFSPQQAKAETSSDVISIEQANKKLDDITLQLNLNKATKAQTDEFLEFLSSLQNNLISSRQEYISEQETLQKKLNMLGPKPELSANEPKDIMLERKEFSAKADKLKVQIAQIDLLSAKIDEINGLILKKRNQELLDSILVKQSSIFHPKEFLDSLATFCHFVFDLSKSPINWYQNLSTENQKEVKDSIFLVFLSIFGAFIFSMVVRLYIKRWFGYRLGIEHPDYWQKARAGIGMFLVKSIVPVTCIGIFLFWLQSDNLDNGNDFGILLQNIVLYLLYYYLIKSAVKITFAPAHSQWRLIEVSDDCARIGSKALIFSTAAICLVSFFQDLATQMHYNQNIIYSLKIFGNAVKAFCIIWVTKSFLYNNRSLSDDEISDDAAITELSISSKASLLISFGMAIAFMVSLFGYIKLSEYVINHFIVSVIMIGIFYIADKLLLGILRRILRLRFWIKTFRISHKTLIKSEFWIGLLLTPIIWIICFLSLLAVWGVSVDLLLARTQSFLVGFNIGGIHISITSILLGIISFFVFLSLFKLLKNSFSDGNLSKIEMDEGIRNSIISSINFLGLIISGILAIAVMGGSLSSLAIIAGALSFGAGLGLQNMVSNLAAGMTILWERPIKIGDWIIINNQEGIVKQINMRFTILETWDKSTVIIPNSDILSQSLINYTYKDKTGRVAIKISVGYESNVKQIREDLLEIASSNENVLNSPSPSVTFSNLGAGLEFQLNCFTDNIFKRAEIGNDLREKIISRFQELNIEMPTSPATVCIEDRRKD